MFPLTKEQLGRAVAELQIGDITQATIRQICSLSKRLEEMAGEPFVHLEIGKIGRAHV